MKLLLDTHLLIWATVEPEKLPAAAIELIENEANEVYFSAASIWEVGIKSGAKPGFNLDPSLLRRALLDAGYEELSITGQHGAQVVNLPKIHGDPFDRILIAQATFEGMELLTRDEKVGLYPGPIKRL